MGRTAPLLLGLASILALAFALTLQLGFGLAPCPLCLEQRIPYGIAIVVALMALPAQSPRMRGLLLLCLALCFGYDAGTAFFHVGVENHWWESACVGGAKLATSPEELIARLTGGHAQPVACDLVRWQLFGLSLATYNMIAAAVLCVGALVSARKTFRAA